ncbi:unnamed protein product [Periconia digitata]|uniref:Uncharacterized protein n=1 Tax=Periconia digitata TaxID=1303443 RepID=A0A9W4U5K4_9PLEO|nr:unnamed protein product [Periconia digitata]
MITRLLGNNDLNATGGYGFRQIFIVIVTEEARHLRKLRRGAEGAIRGSCNCNTAIWRRLSKRCQLSPFIPGMTIIVFGCFGPQSILSTTLDTPAAALVMLARSGSDAGNRLRRSKSTSTVQRQIVTIPEPLDYPALAQQHALAAATTAFARAHDNAAMDRLNIGTSHLDRTKSTSSRKSISSQGSHFPPRGSSFRSTHNAHRQQTSNVQRQSQGAMPIESFPAFYPTPAVERPHSAQPSILLNENMRPGSQLNSQRRSAASSITSQQIRKARSMYYASSVQTGSPIARPPTKYLVNPPLANMIPDPLAPVSATHNRPLTPLPMATSRAPQIPVEIAPGETIDRARDKYLQTFQQRQTKHKPSLFLAPFKKRQEKTKSKDRPVSAGLVSVSSVWRQNPGEILLESLDDFGMPKQKKEKRSFSGSIKNKIKKVFRRTSHSSTEAPAQHANTSRDYSSYMPAQRESSYIPEPNFEIPSPDDLTLTRMRSRTPALERAPSPFVRAVSRGSNTSGGSTRSLHSEQNLTHTSSRVTSWNDSSASGTLTQREIKRLTVIHEAKDSIGSDADGTLIASPKEKVLPPPASGAFTQPALVESLLDTSSTPVDPKRVFSTLMKEIDASKPLPVSTTTSDGSPSTESDIFESSATKELHVVAQRDVHSSGSRSFRPSMSSDQPFQRPATAKSKSSSIRSFSKILRSTIRTVTPSERKVSDKPERTESIRGAVRVPRPSTATSSESDASQGIDQVVNLAAMRGNPLSHSCSQTITHEPQTSRPSAEQIHRRIARSKDRWKSQLDEHMPNRTLYDEHQPYEHSKTIAQTITVTPKSTNSIHLPMEKVGDSQKSSQEQVTPVHASQKSPTSRQLLSPLSPSVYSRNTDGMSILPNDSILSFEEARGSEGGSAIISHSRSVRSYAIGTPSPQRASDSTHSSRDWKAWLSHEVSELTASSSEDIAINESYVPSTGHQRELTQIDDDSMTVVRASMDMPTPRQDPIRSVNTSSSFGDRKIPFKQNDHPASDREPPATPGTANLPAKSLTLITKTLSPVHSGNSSGSASPSGSTPRSSRMNERFPFIETGRRSSSFSARMSRIAGTPPDGSPGSSMKSKAGTPPSRIYTDISAPGSNRTIVHESQSRPSKPGEPANISTTCKENLTPTSSKLKFGDLPSTPKVQFSPANMSRPRSMLPLSSATINRNPSPVAKYTVNQMETPKSSPLSTLAIDPLRRRLKTTLSPASPEKAVLRPKSAFDLRSMKSSVVLTPTKLNNQVAPTNIESKNLEPTKPVADGEKPSGHRRATYRVSAIDNETLRMLIESPWAVSGAPSPRTSLDATSQALLPRSKRPTLKGPSALALNKEPSPGAEGRIIDTLLDTQVTPLDFGGDGGRATAGQRMAERFLRERSVGRGNDFEDKGTSPREGSLKSEGQGGGKLEREDTPAFL